ncbi:hypothetical protein QM325_16035 [Pseudomonas putida]|nr:hypothetical protein [Pseudomonas putida]
MATLIDLFKRDIFNVFEFTRANYSSQGEEGHYPSIDFDLYTLKFLDKNFSIARSTEHHVADDSPYTGSVTDPYYSADSSNPAFLDLRIPEDHHSYLHYAVPVGPEVSYSWHGHSVTFNSVPGQMNVLRINRRDYLPPLFAARDTYWKLFDQHGNEYRVRFTLKDDGNVIGIARYER